VFRSINCPVAAPSGPAMPSKVADRMNLFLSIMPFIRVVSKIVAIFPPYHMPNPMMAMMIWFRVYEPKLNSAQE
jgi:hypothetical protein